MSLRFSALGVTTMLAFAATASAQAVSLYTFSQTAGTYVPITGGTQLAVATASSILDSNNYTVALPFAFPFSGGTYTTVTVQTNGHLSFGTTAPAITSLPLSTTSTMPNSASAFGRDLQGGFAFTGDRTLGSDQLINISSLGPVQVGDQITGTGIPTGTTVLAITGNVITMSATATSTGTAGVVSAYGPWAEMRHETQGTPGNQVFIAQWSNFRVWGSTSTNVKDQILNFQIRLYEATGTIEFSYGNCTPGATTSTTRAQVGLRGATNAFPLNVTNRQNTKGTNDDWINSVPGTANTSGMLFNNVAPANVISNGLTYTWTPPVGTPATSVSYGAGCYNRSATWYELFGTFDLANSSVQLVPNGNGGYTMVPGTPTAFVHTVPGLALTDDSIGTLALPSAFNYPGGSSTALSICSNGFIWLQTSTVTDYTPTAAELFSNPARFAPLWCDMLPDGTANLNNVFAEVDVANNKAYVTWSNVPTLTAGGTVNMQVEFDLTSGIVNYTYGATTLPAIAAITGWTPGTGVSSANGGSIDITASLPNSFSTYSAESIPLALSASSTPALGVTVTYTVSNIPATSLLSALTFSLAQLNPGLDLGFMGAPGCLQLIALNGASTSLLLGFPTATLQFPIPNDVAFVGLPLNLQAATLDTAVNALGVLTSNAIGSVVGNF